MAILQPIHDIAGICAHKNIKEVILCPGSRSAALTMSFARHPEIRTYSVSDERSAAFIGMGMALQSGRTVAIVCTSGSAAYNFAPAITEAFFQEIPLLILTADRPPEWIHQYDGQTIYQRGMYGRHVKKSFELPADYSHPDALWQIERSVNEAVNLTQSSPRGPVHINVPIREPFYPETSEKIDFSPAPRLIRRVETHTELSQEAWRDLMEIWRLSDRKLIAVGQHEGGLSQILKNISEDLGVPVLGDAISNIHKGGTAFISAHDIFCGKTSGLEPDLLITCGRSFLSKPFKQFIREHKPRFHWHIQENPDLTDPFQSVTHKIEADPVRFMTRLFEDLDFLKFREGDEEEDTDFLESWKTAQHQSVKILNAFIAETASGEFHFTDTLLRHLPENSVLHIGNSMPVRYVNYLGIPPEKNITVSANRGTSGIDGILSTAVGQAVSTDAIVTCLIGDVSFQYDINALWNTFVPKNLRIVVINNHGGNIFRIIDGPDRQAELEDYFVTKQLRDASATAGELDYYAVTKSDDSFWNEFFKPGNKARLVEFFTDGKADNDIFQQFKSITQQKLTDS